MSVSKEEFENRYTERLASNIYKAILETKESTSKILEKNLGRDGRRLARTVLRVRK